MKNRRGKIKLQKKNNQNWGKIGIEIVKEE